MTDSLDRNKRRAISRVAIWSSLMISLLVGVVLFYHHASRPELGSGQGVFSIPISESVDEKSFPDLRKEIMEKISNIIEAEIKEVLSEDLAVRLRQRDGGRNQMEVSVLFKQADPSKNAGERHFIEVRYPVFGQWSMYFDMGTFRLTSLYSVPSDEKSADTDILKKIWEANTRIQEKVKSTVLQLARKVG